MTTLQDELRDLLADARAILDLEIARGVQVAIETPLPPADEEVLEAVTAELEAAPAQPPPAPSLPKVAAWGALAAKAREAARGSEPGSAPGTAEPPTEGPGPDADLDAVRASLGDCRRCGLCEGRTHIVFGVGDRQADLMVIGEGPGEQEDLRGEPFVGPAGQMLDRMLKNVVGLDRREVYIANVVKCRPPGNRDPAEDEIASCLPFLKRQIAVVQPKLILVLGRVAASTLLGVRSITRERGQERTLQGVPAIPMLHPAYLLRRAEAKRDAFEDLKLARRRYDELGGRR